MQYSVTRLGISVLGLLGQAGVTTAAPPKHPPMRGTNDTNEAETPWEPDHDRWSSHSFQCSNLTYARLDPLIFPGEVSPHLHLVFGGSGFGPKLRSELSRCTSCEIVDDASIYWVPSLFVQIDGGVQPIPTDEIKVYYQ